MSDLTIQESFHEPLPRLRQQECPFGYRSIPRTISLMIDAPKALYKSSEKPFFELALEALATLDPASAELSSHLPQVEQTHYLSTEADVLRAAHLYLIHPVIVVTSRLIEYGEIICRSDVTAGRCRTDIRYFFNEEARAPLNLAVVEFKNTQVIHHDDFLSALTDRANAKRTVERTWEADDKNNTLLRGNAIPLCRQAKKYAEDLSTDVMIFDWRTVGR